MPRRTGKVPSYCRHKASGRAVVHINGAQHYLGIYGSDESHAEYQRVIAEWRCGKLASNTSERRASDSEQTLSLIHI